MAACAAPAAPVPTQTATVETTAVVRTLAAATPQAYPVVDCDDPSGGQANPACITPQAETKIENQSTAQEAAQDPARGAVVTAYPVPEPTTLASPTVEIPAQAAAAEEPVPYADCARTPGLPGCGAETVSIVSRLAFVEGQPQRLVGLDLRSGAGWQAPLTGEALWLAWSPDGAKLLAALPDNLYAVFTARGELAETFSSETAPNWQPDGQLSLDGSVHAGDGWRAVLVRARETRWDLHFKRDSIDERIIPLDSLPADSFYVLRAWVPGTQKVLLQAYTASGGALQSGGRLLVADTLAATLTPYEINAPLRDDAFAFNPARGTLLALYAGGAGPAAGPEGGPEGGRRLALLDLATNQLRYPLPEGVIPTGMAWQPDGARLALSVGPLAPNASDAARQAFPGPGIYLLDPQSGEVSALLQSPAPAVDGWPQWSADGHALLYARILPQQDGSQGVEVRALQVDWGGYLLLGQGLPAPPTAAGQPAWNRILALVTKEMLE